MDQFRPSGVGQCNDPSAPLAEVSEGPPPRQWLWRRQNHLRKGVSGPRWAVFSESTRSRERLRTLPGPQSEVGA
eukprot:2083401-Pyramimonas_sp.AAC.1